MATVDGAYLKELHKLVRDISKLTEGQSRVELDEDDTREFLLFITPRGGYYRGATFRFRVNANKYPEEPPGVTCLNRIYHPNIDLMEDDIEASVCVSLLGEDWESGVGLDGCVMAILFLFYQPNLEDPLNPVIDSTLQKEEFYANVRASLRGEEVEGVKFDTLILNEDEDNTEMSVSKHDYKEPQAIYHMADNQTGTDVQDNVNDVTKCASNAAAEKLTSDCHAAEGDSRSVEVPATSQRNVGPDNGVNTTRTELPIIMDELQLSAMGVSTEDHSYGYKREKIWIKTLYAFGRFYRWLKTYTCTKSQIDIYTISPTISTKT